MDTIKLIVIGIFISVSIHSSAQQFSQAIGIRGGYSSGFEYRVYADDINSYKLLLSNRDNGLQAAILKEFHQYDLFDFSEQIVFVYGIGIHAGYKRWDSYHFFENTRWVDTHTSFIAGLDGLAALEYTFSEVPISLGLEVKPFFDVFGRRIFDVQLFDFGFTLKYLF